MTLRSLIGDFLTFSKNSLLHTTRIEIVPYPSENNVRNILFPFNGIDADILLLFHRLFESGCIRIIPNVNGCHPVSNLSKKSDQRFQVSNFHVGNNEEIQFFPSLDQWPQVL